MKQISDKTYRALKDQIDKLENKKWKPEDSDRYYFINDCGEMGYYLWGNSSGDNWLYDQGNCFQTKGEAEHHLKVLNAQAKIRNSSEFVPDWSNAGQSKWLVYYDYDVQSLTCVSYGRVQFSGVTYYATEKEAEQAIKDLKEEYLLVLGVK